MTRVGDLIIQVFEDSGYRFRWRKGRSLVFSRNGEDVHVYLFPERVNRDRLLQLPPGRKVLICLKGWEEGVAGAGEGEVCELWDEKMFHMRLGESVFRRAMDRVVPPGGTDGTDDVGPRIPKGIEEGVVQATVDLEMAKEMGERVDGFKHDLTHVPWYLFDLEYMHEGRERKASIAVNALSGDAVRWEAMLVLRDDAGMSITLPEPGLGAKDALLRAVDALDEMTMMLSTPRKKDYESVVVVDRPVPIDRSGVRVVRSGLFYFPTWVIEGLKGRLVVNGFTGEVMEESFLEEVENDRAQ